MRNDRAEAFGEDIGQNGWLTADEQDLFLGWVGLTPESRLLDIACGSGGPTLRIAARARAERERLAARAAFEPLDAGRPLPFADAAFDGLICIDAVNHLPHRDRVFREWARVLCPGGRLVFTDPIVVTGALSSEEIAARSSIGFFLFVPVGTDERLLGEAGFELVEVAALLASERRLSRFAFRARRPS